MRDTWNDIAMPILRAVQGMEAEESGAGKNLWGGSIKQVAERMGKSVNEIGPQVDSLECSEHISVRENPSTSGHPHNHMGIQLLPKGRKALGEWPADPMTALAIALARALEAASNEAVDDEERSHLKALAEKVRTAGAALGPTLAGVALSAIVDGVVG